jgi:hypothetical protein
VRSSLSVDWVGLATSKRSPGEALLRPPCDFVGAERLVALQRAPRAAGRRSSTASRYASGSNKRAHGNSRGTIGRTALGVAVGRRVNELLGRECADKGAETY